MHMKINQSPATELQTNCMSNPTMFLHALSTLSAVSVPINLQRISYHNPGVSVYDPKGLFSPNDRDDPFRSFFASLLDFLRGILFPGDQHAEDRKKKEHIQHLSCHDQRDQPTEHL